MGAKYSTQATAGYNSSAPADDGSQTASNLITWAGIKSKLADVLKTFGEAINTALVNAFDYSVRSITGSDSTVASDHMRCVEVASTVTTAVTIALGDAATMTNVYRVFVKNSSARNQTVGRVTGADTIDGSAANITLPPSAGVVFQTNSAANGYVITSWYGPFSDGSPVISGGTDGTKKVRFEVDGLTTATTRVLTVRDADFELGAATQAEQETGTSLVASVTPGRQQFHPSAAKAWAIADFAGAMSASYNMSSVSDGGAGLQTFNYSTAFSTANYCAIAVTEQTPGGTAATTGMAIVGTGGDKTASACLVRTISFNAFAATDSSKTNFVAFGDQ